MVHAAAPDAHATGGHALLQPLGEGAAPIVRHVMGALQRRELDAAGDGEDVEGRRDVRREVDEVLGVPARGGGRERWAESASRG